MKSVLGAAIIAVVLLPSLTSLPLAAVFTAPEASLTNADVVKLAKSGLGEDVIIAKITEAHVEFQLDPDSLISLKEKGVTDGVIAAMLKKAAQPQAMETSRPGVRLTGTPTGAILVDTASASAVTLATASEELSLWSVDGASSTAGPYGEYHFLDYPEIRAEARTADRRPSFLVRSTSHPLGRFFVVRVDPDKGDRCRSLKIGHGGPFGKKGGRSPDPDWTFPFDATESQPGTWRLQLRKDLKPGEYGVFDRDGQLFAFGVDKERK